MNKNEMLNPILKLGMLLSVFILAAGLIFWRSNLYADEILFPKDAQSTASLELIGYLPQAVPYNSALPDDMIVNGDYIYATGTFDLDVYDVSNPSNPLLKHQDLVNFVGRMDRKGNFLYTSHSGFSAIFKVFDISNDQLPVEVSSQNSVQTDWGGHGDIVVHGNYIYGIREHDEILDVITTTPISPTLVTSIPTPDPGGSITATGNRVYTHFGRTLTIFDISVPTNPVVLGTAELGINSNASTNIIARDNLLYINGEKFGIFDVSDPNNVNLVGSRSGAFLSYYGMDIVYPYAFLIEFDGSLNGYDRLIVLDISNPASPTEVARSPLYDYDDGLAVVNSGEYVYVGARGLYVFQFLPQGGATNPDNDIYLPFIQR